MSFKTKELLTDLARPLSVVVAVSFGIAAGASHLHSGGFQTPAVLATVGAFLATLLHPVAPWRWGFFLMLSVPGAYVIAEAFGLSAGIPTIQPTEAVAAFGSPTIAAYLAYGLVTVLVPVFKRQKTREQPGGPR